MYFTEGTEHLLSVYYIHWSLSQRATWLVLPSISVQFNKLRLRIVLGFPQVAESECKSKHLAINLKHTFHHTTLLIHSSHKYWLHLYCMPGKVLGANGPCIPSSLFLFSPLISSRPIFRQVPFYLIYCKKSYT